MTSSNSIARFFADIDCHFQCYDMGRLIHPIKNQQWLDFEENLIPWPSPYLQHAWIGITFSECKEHKNKEQQHHTVWFLKLPLDELSRLNLSARDDFLHRLYETLGFFLQQKKTNNHDSVEKTAASLENAMKDNPYGFQPKQEAMANFHAIVHKHLALDASSYYQTTQQYLSTIKPSANIATTSKKQWEQLGIQGFADISARLDEKYQSKNNQQQLIDSIELLPVPVLRVLGLCMENHQVSRQFTQAIFHLTTTKIADLDKIGINSLTSICIAAIRATAQSKDQQGQRQLLISILNSPVGTDIELLASISGRCWQQFTHNKLLSLYIETLAITDKNTHPGAFNAIISDLMFIPGFRDNILQAFRSTNRSEVLVQAIAGFFKHFNLTSKGN